MNALAEKLGLWEKFRRSEALENRREKTRGYDPEVNASAFILSACNGGNSLADAERLDKDEVLKELVGIKKFPDQSTLGEWLRHLGQEGIEQLRQINRELVQKLLTQVKSNRVLYDGRVEVFFDDTQIEVTGKCFEGAEVNYEGKTALGWQTLWAGDFIADGILGPAKLQAESPYRQEEVSGDVSGFLPELVEQNKGLWEGKETYFYADSASSANKYVKVVEEHFDRWSISYNKWTSNLDKLCEKVPDQFWSEAEHLSWRNGKKQIVQYSWLRHQVKDADKPYLFAVVRYCPEEEFFWRYAYILCEEGQREDPKRVFEQHRLKGDRERGFDYVLNDLDLHHPPCKSLIANQAFYLLNMIAYNLLLAIKILHLPDDQQHLRIRSLIKYLITMPVQRVNHARKMCMKLYVPECLRRWWRLFCQQVLPHCKIKGLPKFAEAPG